MTRIAFIGAGSLGFTRGLVRDILTFPRLHDATLVMMDIDAERLEFARASAERIVALAQCPARVEATLDLATALDGADIVLVTILAHGLDVWRHDIEVPRRYGIDTNIGDTRGPSGIFRGLRTIPKLLEIAREMERRCPDAIMLNYTNPMVMLCRALQHETSIKVVGLCHSVQGTSEMLARWIGAPYDEITFLAAGINHMAWFLRFDWRGHDAIPLIRQAILEQSAIANEEQVRNELFLALDYYPTESSGHHSEYNWWFRKRPDLIERYCTHGTGWNPGAYAAIIRWYESREGSWRDEARAWFAAERPISLARGHEYAASIINALRGGEPFEFNGNVANTGLISNLPEGACVEVPVWASRQGLRPVHVGPLPASVAMLTSLTAQLEELAVSGALSGDPRAVYQAIAHDPLSAAVASLAELRAMVNELFAINREYLPQFRHFSV
jgi:alpha-galactosidase